jgi:hypothetical protein
METQIFPEKIKMSNLPFFFQGWNTVLKKTNEFSDGAPVYRLNGYKLYYIIPIIGITIRRIAGRWYLHRDCDYINLFAFMGKKKTPETVEKDPLPCGEWTYGGIVTEYKKRRWF